MPRAFWQFLAALILLGFVAYAVAWVIAAIVAAPAP